MEGKLSELEYHLLENERWDDYKSFLANAKPKNRKASAENLCYAIALAHSFEKSGGADQYMFIGGLGVFGNLFRYLSESHLFDYRSVHDIDIVLRSRPYEYVVSDFFDFVDTKRSSLSIKSKLILKGSCVDVEGERLRETSIDAYIPDGDPHKGALINDFQFDYYQWESRKRAEFFEVPFYTASPLTLLHLKLNVTTGKKGKSRRLKDCQDIWSLVGVLERDGCSPGELYGGLSEAEYKRLTEVFSENCSRCSECGLVDELPTLTPSSKYLNKFIELGEKK